MHVVVGVRVRVFRKRYRARKRAQRGSDESEGQEQMDRFGVEVKWLSVLGAGICSVDAVTLAPRNKHAAPGGLTDDTVHR